MLVLVSLFYNTTHSLQMKHTNLEFGFGSKIYRFLSVQAKLNQRFSFVNLMFEG